MKHLKFGGSTAARTMACPAWHGLSEQLPRVNEANNQDAADQGTLLHNVMEEYYGEKDIGIGTQIDEGRHYKDQKLTQDLLEVKIKPAIRAVEKLLVDLDIPTWRVEPFVTIDADIGGSIDMLGLSDDKKTVLILDYKFGYNTVDVANNKQLQFYALAAATDQKTRGWFDECEKIVLAIIQPNDNGEDCQTWELDMDGLDNFETAYLDAVEASEDADPLPASGSHCRYCPAHAICPVKTGAALKANRVNDITADKLAEYLPLAEEVIAWAKEVQKLAYEQMELGVAVDGYKLVNKRASRVWNDISAVGEKIRKARKIKIEDGFDLKLKSPAQLEKTCKKLDVDFKAYTKYISSVSSGTTIAKASDPRPAALPITGLAQLNAMND